MTSRRFALALAVSLVLAGACGGGGDDDDDAPANADASAGGIDAAPGADSSGAEDLNMMASDFECIKNGTKVHNFYVRNELGHLDEALAVANSPTGGTYPVGTIVQLVPFEAMVKRGAGYNPTTNDWEFFFLEINGAETTIGARGVEDVENQFGGNCFDCHSKAEAQWDLICEKDHGCDPLPLNDQLIQNLQDGDSRCE